jgi:hypothetical protein
MKATPGVWFATHEEVARYCREQAGGGVSDRRR